MFGTQAYGTKDIRTRARNAETDLHDDAAGRSWEGMP
jgi:hypothetical protein